MGGAIATSMAPPFFFWLGRMLMVGSRWKETMEAPSQTRNKDGFLWRKATLILQLGHFQITFANFAALTTEIWPPSTGQQLASVGPARLKERMTGWCRSLSPVFLWLTNFFRRKSMWRENDGQAKCQQQSLLPSMQCQCHRICHNLRSVDVRVSDTFFVQQENARSLSA